MGEQPSGTVTFLFTDIEGSTKLLEKLGPQDYAEALAEHRSLLREAIAHHAGYEVDCEGDAFFVAFSTASEAVSAAAEAQRKLARGPIRVRMGLHTGEPLLASPKYVGLDVHKAARIMAAGHGGQVLVSQTTCDLLAELPDGTVLCDLGKHRLKDLTAPERLHQLGEDEFPPLRSLNASNLPVQLNPLVGREREVEELTDLFRGSCRLVTLTGPGGIGKTRLGLQVAAELVSDLSDGVWLVDLAPLREPGLVLATIAQTLGVREQIGRTIDETLADRLREQNVLLVLDNFEQVVEAASELADLLARAPGLKLLVTSRAALRLSGEREFAVPPLLVEESALLFAERAQAVKSTFALDDSRALIAEICLRLDNLPLAIELAAARVRVLEPQAMLERLDRRLKLLTGGARDRPARQQTLRGAIEWSYDLLDAAEQQALCRLAVFVGGWTLEAAESACNVDLDTLESLVDKSLVRMEDSRFSMLETIREYAAERLEESGEAESVRGRHAQHFRRLVKPLRTRLRGGVPEVVAMVRAELDNCRAALAWALREDASCAVDIASPLVPFWILRGHLQEGLAWGRQAHRVSAGLSDPERVRALTAVAELERLSGHIPEALALKEEELALARRAGDKPEVIALLDDMCDLVYDNGDPERARALSDESLERAERLGDPHSLGHALHARGLVEFRSGEFHEARAVFVRGLTMYEQHSSPSDVAGLELMAAECARRLGELEDARRSLRRALEIFVESGMRAAYPELFQEIAGLALEEGDPDYAARLLGASDAILPVVGLRRWDPDDYERSVTTARTQLGEEAFESLRNEGRLLGEERALAEARERLTGSSA